MQKNYNLQQKFSSEYSTFDEDVKIEKVAEQSQLTQGKRK